VSSVLHIASYASGGAFKVVAGLHEECRRNNVVSNILTRFDDNGESGVYALGKRSRINLKHILQRITVLLNGESALKDLFTMPRKHSNISAHALFRSADVIHLHWVADMLGWGELPILAKKKIVLTLHDMNPFTGGCHQSYGCEQFKSGCSDCPQLGARGKAVTEYFSMKMSCLGAMDKESMVVVAPSRWIAEQSMESLLFRKFAHRIIPHVIDTSVFKPMPTGELRKRLGIPEELPLVLFVSVDLDNHRKGLQPLLEELAAPLGEARIGICLVGRSRNGRSLKEHPHVYCLGRVRDASFLAQLYNMSDIHVTLSEGESFGLTVAESLCCGTPVICRDIPVMREHVIAGKNGMLYNRNDIPLADVVMEAVLKRFDRDMIATEAASRYGSHRDETYLALYRELTA